VLYHTRARRPLQDVLTCIRHGVTLATAGRKMRDNDEHDLKAPTRSPSCGPTSPAAVLRTLEIAARCTLSLGRAALPLPAREAAERRHHERHLRALTYQGAAGATAAMPRRRVASSTPSWR
jgi:error-prone DNA polymerase